METEGLKAIGEALNYAIAAGRLRVAIREHGTGLRGLERLADRYSETAADMLGAHYGRSEVRP